MRPAIAVLILLLPASAYAQKDGPKIRFPLQAVEPTAPVGKLTGSTFYIIDSDVPLIVTSSPLGLVSITEEEGPIKMRGIFSDGSGKVETKTYKGKYVFSIEAVASGKCELLVIPATAKSAADILRKPLEVDMGGKPVDPVDPPPKKRVAFHVYFIGCDAGVSAKVKNDQGLRDWITGNGMAWDAFSTNAPQVAQLGLELAVKTAGGAPCVLFVGDDGYGVIVGGPVLSVNQVKVLGTPYLRGK